MNNPPKKAKGYDPGLERSRSQDRNRPSDSERQPVPRFFIKNKFARLVANIVISLIWVLISLTTFVYGIYLDMQNSCKVNIFGRFYCPDPTPLSVWAFFAFFVLFTFGPPLWLTWYLWIRKRLPKNK